jgi:hypothetical protein
VRGIGGEEAAAGDGQREAAEVKRVRGAHEPGALIRGERDAGGPAYGG